MKCDISFYAVIDQSTNYERSMYSSTESVYDPLLKYNTIQESNSDVTNVVV